MTKTPITQAIKLLEKNLAFMNHHKNGNDFFMELYDENEQAHADLQAWVNDVPKHWTNNHPDDCEDAHHDYTSRAAKHLLKGIEDE